MRPINLSHIIAAFAFMFSLSVHAARVPREQADLQSHSTHVVQGVIVEPATPISQSTDDIIVHLTATLKVTKVEKGQNVQVGDLLHIRLYSENYALDMPHPPSGGGHNPLPKLGEHGQVYLTFEIDEWEMETQQGVYFVQHPNGWNPLSR